MHRAVVFERTAGFEIGVRRMLGQNADRLVERDMRQGAGIDVAKEVLAILEMLGAPRRPVGVVGIVGEGLMVELEERIRMPDHRGVPAT